MEYKQVQYYSVLMAGPVSSSGRLPRRGNIKKQIFASVAASILASPKALKRTGKALAKIIRASCNTCCPQKIYPTTSGLDLVREGWCCELQPTFQRGFVIYRGQISWGGCCCKCAQCIFFGTGYNCTEIIFFFFPLHTALYSQSGRKALAGPSWILVVVVS